MADEADHAREQSGYQPDSVDPRKVWAMVGVLLLAVLLSAGVIAWLINTLEAQHLAHQPPLSDLEREHLLPPEPRLEVAPRLDGIRYRQQAQQRLNSYGWNDQQQGIAHIPLHKAQQLMLQRGWPQHYPSKTGETHAQ